MSNLCKICGNTTRQIHHKTFGVYHLCQHCDFISKDKGDHISTHQALDIYDSHQNSIHDLVYVEYFTDFLDKAVFPFISSYRNGLDFGSGPSPVLAQMLRDTYGYNMDIYDLYYSPIKSYLDKTYDLISVTEVVEHLEDPMQYFSLFVEHCNEDGILAVMTHFHSKNEEEFLNWHYIRDRSHVSFFNVRTFEVIAKKMNLEIIYTDHKKYLTLKKMSKK
jgi:hypothetical protein